MSGRVVREYVGGGLVGQLAAAMDAKQRAEREARAQAWRAERARLEAADAPLVALFGGCDLLVGVALSDAGYHQHHGEWRRRCEQKALKAATKGPASRVNELVRRAQAGDTRVLAALRKIKDASWWEEMGDLARNAETSLLTAVGSENGFLREAVPRRLAALKAELAGASPTPLERVLVERIAACWLQV